MAKPQKFGNETYDVHVLASSKNWYNQTYIKPSTPNGKTENTIKQPQDEQMVICNSFTKRWQLCYLNLTEYILTLTYLFKKCNNELNVKGIAFGNKEHNTD